VNLLDFDTWVLFMPTFPGVVGKDTIFSSMTMDYVYEALVSGTRIVVLGDPTVNVQFYLRPIMSFLFWTGYDFGWNKAGGDTKVLTKAAGQFKLQEYLQRLTRWGYGLKSATRSAAFQYSKMVQEAYASNEDLRLNRLSLAENRNGELISFALTLGRYLRDGRIITEYESILFVPFGQIDPSEALRLVLKETLNISLSQEPPAWATGISAPGQFGVDAVIAEIRGEIEERNAILESRKEERVALRSCLQVLYQIGPSLEDAVKAMLQELGGTVEEPAILGHCDGYLMVSIEGVDYKAVLEIKGALKQQFDMNGFRQVLQWKNDAMLEKDDDYRPVFIGNSDAENPPEARPDPFGAEWKKQTKRAKVTALTTTTLYKAYRALKDQRLDVTKFWMAVFTTDGIFEFNESLFEP
jgi:hypothetical protein